MFLRRKQNGQGLTEFALILPILLLVILGIIEGGWLIWAYITVQNAAREGARYAVTGAPLNTAGDPWSFTPEERVEAIRQVVRDRASGLPIDAFADQGAVGNDITQDISGMDYIQRFEDPRVLGILVRGQTAESVAQAETAGVPDPGFVYHPGEKGLNVLVRVYYNAPMLDPIYDALLRGNAVHLSGEVVLQNEGINLALGSELPPFAAGQDDTSNADTTQQIGGSLEVQQNGNAITEVPAGELVDFALQNHQGGQLYFICDGTLSVASVTVGANGSAIYTNYFIPPGTSEGLHTFTTHLNDATCDPNTQKASYDVVILASTSPAITISDPGHAVHSWPDNSLVDVSVSTHDPNSTYQIYFDGAAMQDKTGANCMVSTDGSGQGTVTDCVIPNDITPATYPISTTFAANTVEVTNATVEVVQGSDVYDKQTIDIVLRDHAPNHDYYVYFGPNAVDIVTTNSDGEAITQYFIPAGTEGNGLIVQTQDRQTPVPPNVSRQIAATTVNVSIPTTPLIVAPDSAPAGEVIRIQLRKHSATTNYDVRFAGNLVQTIGTDTGGDTVEFTYRIPITMQGVKMIRSYLENSTSVYSATHNINVLPVPYIEIVGGDRHTPGETITIQLQNHAASTPYDVYIDLNGDGTLSADELIRQGIITDGSGFRSFQYTIPTTITPIGIDPADAHPIASYRNGNEIARTNLFVIAADLRVTSITPPSDPQPGLDLPIAVEVTNQSPVTLTGFIFDNDLYVDPAPGIPNASSTFPPGNQKLWINGLGPNQTKMITPSVTVFSLGTHELYGRADTSNGVVETVETNNILGTTMDLVCNLTPFVDNFDDNVIGPSWTFTPFGDAVAPAPPPPPELLVMEAEDATLSGNFSIGNSGSASGGQYIVAGGSSAYYNASDINENNKAVFNFVVGTAGAYRIRGNVYAANGNSDSFWVRVNGVLGTGSGGNYNGRWNIATNTNYQADWVSNDSPSIDPMEWNLSEGPVTVEILLREPNARLDKLELVPESNWASLQQQPAELLAMQSIVDPATLRLSGPPALPVLQANAQFVTVEATQDRAQNNGYSVDPAVLSVAPAAIPQQQALVDPPTNLAANTVSQTQIDLSWNHTVSAGGTTDYLDGTFSGNNNTNDNIGGPWQYNDLTNGSHVTGQHVNQGNPGGALQVHTGGNGTNATNIAGAWSNTFTLNSNQDVTVILDYRLEIPSDFESDEYGEARLAIDGTVITLAHFDGRNFDQDTGWQTFNQTFSNLSAGTHTIELIGYNNKKTQGSEQVTVRFDNVQVSGDFSATPPTAFEIQRSTDGINWALLTTVPYPGAQASYTHSDTSVGCGSTFFYRVRAVSDNGSSTYSNQDSATTSNCSPFTDPSNLVVTANTNGGNNVMDLSWEDNSNDETEFRIERSTDGINWSQIDTVSGSNSSTPQTLTYTDTSVNCETRYFYRVIAYRASDGATSNPTNADDDTTGTCPPASLLCTASQEADEVLTLCSSGSGILKNNDNNAGSGYVFMNRPINSFGFEMVVRLDTVPGVNGQSLAGLEVRETLNGNAKKASLVIRNQNTQEVGAFSRATNNGAVSQVAGWTNVGGDIPTWLRLVRANGFFYFYYNTTTENTPALGAWSLLGSVPETMGSNVYVGLINSSASGTLSGSDWRQFQVGCLAMSSATCGVVNEEEGQVAVNAINYTDNFQSSSSPDKWIETTSSSGGHAAMTYNGSNYDEFDYRAAPMLEYSVNIEQSGQYYVWVLAYTTNSGDTVHLGLDGARITLMEDKAGSGLHWFNTTSGGNSVSLNLSQGIHTLNIWGAEAGFQLVQILLTTQPPVAGGFTPSGTTPFDQSACMVPVPPEFPPNLQQCTSVFQNHSFETGVFGSSNFVWTGEKVVHGSSAYVPPNESSSFGMLMQGRVVGRVPILAQTFDMPNWINDNSTAKLTLFKHVNQLPNPPNFVDRASPNDKLIFGLRDQNGNELMTPMVIATGSDLPDGDANYANSNWVQFPVDAGQDNNIFNTFTVDKKSIAGKTVTAYFEVPNNDASNPYSTDFAIDIAQLQVCTQQTAPPAQAGNGIIEGQLSVFINGSLKAIQGVPVWAYKVDGPLQTTYTVNTPPGSKNYSFHNLEPGVYVVYAQFVDQSGVTFGASASVNVTADNVSRQNLLLVLGGN